MSADRPLLALEDQHLIGDAMAAFNARCEADEYTDTGLLDDGGLWDLFDAAMAIMNHQEPQYRIKFGCDPRHTLRRYPPMHPETKP